jgi:Tfp pilus assembly protein PilO
MAVVKYKDSVQRLLNTPQKKTYTFLGVTLLLILVLLFGAIRPTLVTITQLRAQIKESKRVEARLQQKINTLNSFQKDYNRLEDDFQMLNYYFPKDSDYSLLMANLESIIKSYGFELSNLSVESVEEESHEQTGKYAGMVPVEASIRIVGNQNDLIDLMEYLEGLPIILEITSVRFAPGEADNPAQINFSVSFTMYRMSSDTAEI